MLENWKIQQDSKIQVPDHVAKSIEQSKKHNNKKKLKPKNLANVAYVKKGHGFRSNTFRKIIFGRMPHWVGGYLYYLKR